MPLKNERTAQKSNSSKQAAIFIAVAAVSLPGIALADSRTSDTSITQFTPGDYLVMRGGDAANSDAPGAPDFNGEVNSYIDEYSQSGYYVGTLALPTMTLPGANDAEHQGGLNISPNGQWIAFAGYDPNPTAVDPAGSPAGPNVHASDGTETVYLGEVNLQQGPSSLNTSTTLPGSQSFPNNLTGQYIHSAITIDGNEFYVAGKYNETASGNLQSSDTGLLYVNGTGASSTDTVLEGGTDWRNILIFNGQLYGATGSSSVGIHGAYEIGSGLPTSNTPIPAHNIITNYSGGQSASSLSLVDMQTTDASAGTSNGYNVLYTIGDQSVPGITKYYYDPINQVWQHAGFQVPLNSGNNIIDPTGIVAAVDPTNPAWIDLTVSGENGIYSYIDKSGDPETGLTSNAFSQLIAPPSFASFYGMTQDPDTTNVAPANLVWSPAAGQTWDAGTTANWTYAGSAAKFANGENVTFDDTAASSQPVALNTIVQPASVTFESSKNSYTISGTGSIAGPGSLRLLPGNTSTVTLSTANTYTGGTTVSGGVLKILPTGTSGSALGSGALSINGGAVQLAASQSSSANITSLSISNNGTLDINNNHLFINYGSGPDPIASIAALLAAGYAGGAWNGIGGIDTTAPLVVGGLTYGIGYADGADAQHLATGLTSGTIEIKYTLLGDADLNGIVNGIDFGILAANFNKGITGWDEGDFDYNNIVNGLDFGDLAANFNKGAAGTAGVAALDAFAAANGLLADVPEPTTLGLVLVAGAGLLGRRRRASL